MAGERIVVLRPGALGDALLAFPALVALRRAHPRAHLTLIARDDVLALTRANSLADAAYPFDLPAWSGLWGDVEDADPLLRAVVGGADTVVAWLRDDDGDVARRVTALGVGRAIVAPGRPPNALGATWDDGAETLRHAALHLLATLAPLGLEGLPTTLDELARMTPVIAGDPEDERRAAAAWRALRLPAEGVVALHPGSGGAAKCWPAARFADVGLRLRASGYTPLLVEGPADAARVADVVATMAAGDPAPPPVARELSVGTLAALLARCSGYAGNDSGVSHLAGLVGIPTLALFGPTDPAVWSPIGPRVCVVRAPATAATRSIEALDAGTVWAALDALLRAAGTP